jgi:hypothetical protein
LGRQSGSHYICRREQCDLWGGVVDGSAVADELASDHRLARVSGGVKRGHPTIVAPVDLRLAGGTQGNDIDSLRKGGRKQRCLGRPQLPLLHDHPSSRRRRSSQSWRRLCSPHVDQLCRHGLSPRLGQAPEIRRLARPSFPPECAETPVLEQDTSFDKFPGMAVKLFQC